MFTNKHVIAALIITPILAVLGYFAVDALVKEKPHKAMQGENYELLAKPNCRYSSGVCEMKNGNFEVRFTLEEKDNSIVLNLESVFPLDGGKISLSAAGAEPVPTSLFSVSDDKRIWQAKFFIPYTGTERMLVALSAKEALYYGETIAAFAEYKTSFGKDFRRYDK